MLKNNTNISIAVSKYVKIVFKLYKYLKVSLSYISNTRNILTF